MPNFCNNINNCNRNRRLLGDIHNNLIYLGGGGAT